MESKDSGFDKIEQDYAGKGESYKPYISADNSSFTLVLPNLTFAPGVIDENTIPEIHIEGILNGKNDFKILSYCFSKSRSAKEIAEYLGINASTYFRKETLGKLVEQNYLIEDKTGTAWKYLSNPDKVFV